MKILVVTSEVTFVPENYNLFLKSLFDELANDGIKLHALIVLKNNSLALSLKGLGLIIMGAKKTGLQLIKNSITAITKDHQKMAELFQVETLYFDNPNSEEFINYVKNQKIDLIINARTRYIYKNKTLKAPRLGCINIHHGILPNYRGTMCDLYALFEKRPAGFTIHIMESCIDTGKIIKTKEVTNSKDSTSHGFLEHIRRSSEVEGKELASIIKTIKKNGTIPIEAENISTNPIYTKNPDGKKIREMLSQGMIL